MEELLYQFNIVILNAIKDIGAHIDFYSVNIAFDL